MSGKVESDPFEPPVAPKAERIAQNVKDAVPSGGKLFGKQSKLREQIKEIQMWEQPVKSLGVVGAITFAYYMTGEDGYSLYTLVCMVLIFRIVSVSVLKRMVVSVNKKEKAKSLGSALQRTSDMIEGFMVVPTPSQVTTLVQGVADMLEAFVNCKCNKLREASQPTKEGAAQLKKTIAMLAGVGVVLWMFEVRTLVYFYVLFQLTWPAVYARHPEKVDKVHAQVAEKVQPHVEKAKEQMDVVQKIVEDKMMIAAGAVGEKAEKAYTTVMEKYEARFKKNASQSKKTE
mmetsp:Transcript_4706/g.7085  ORF Transcript_4706/g.7085 Transcript_4706/m.7085 type:complete len:287 (-) Transcript_4706:1978-2838(-)|eukprot:CAMPEP_0203743770 /NCGR_PEP_ID=MMETSP0098-20131031/63_1 /ASSEMBLY_ACC=CAM_ASM_000208 /TAXON_ID=96639 /ORGANISM=" , Strain NY0313808BC1" /LENGTH=286 /DNA_ID=CAMNT_0050631097 /DNA_START=621 /DNA_END=1481 /DNA_ORIENTATION=-